MNLRIIVSEAWRNLSTGTSRAVLYALLFAGFVALAAISDVLTVSTLQARATQFRDSGAAIRTLIAEDLIDAASCDALAAHPLMSAAGALAARDPLTFAAMPANSIPGFEVSPGLAGVLHVNEREASGAWISEQLAATLSAAPGDALDTDTGRLTIAGTFPWPDDGRDSRLGYAVLLPSTAAAAYDECWATVWPTAKDADTLLRAAARVQADSSTPLNLSQVNKNFGASFDGYDEWQHRVSRHAPMFGAVIGASLGFAAARSRRLEYAGALHAGAHKRDVLAIALFETLVWSMFGAVVAGAAIAVTATAATATAAEAAHWAAPADYSEELVQFVWAGLRTVCVAVGAAACGTTIALASVHERHLFRYFKDR